MYSTTTSIIAVPITATTYLQASDITSTVIAIPAEMYFTIELEILSDGYILQEELTTTGYSLVTEHQQITMSQYSKGMIYYR